MVFPRKVCDYQTTKNGQYEFQSSCWLQKFRRVNTETKTICSQNNQERSLGLPDKIYTTRQVDLTSTQIEHYMSMKKTSVVFLEEGGMVTAPEVMTRLLRLQQLLCGYLVDDDGETIEIS